MTLGVECFKGEPALVYEEFVCEGERALQRARRPRSQAYMININEGEACACERVRGGVAIARREGALPELSQSAVVREVREGVRDLPHVLPEPGCNLPRGREAVTREEAERLRKPGRMRGEEGILERHSGGEGGGGAGAPRGRCA